MCWSLLVSVIDGILIEDEICGFIACDIHINKHLVQSFFFLPKKIPVTFSIVLNRFLQQNKKALYIYLYRLCVVIDVKMLTRSNTSPLTQEYFDIFCFSFLSSPKWYSWPNPSRFILHYKKIKMKSYNVCSYNVHIMYIMSPFQSSYDIKDEYLLYENYVPWDQIRCKCRLRNPPTLTIHLL